MSPSQSQETLKAQFVSSGGIWGQAWDTILKTDPVYFASYLRIRSVPINNRKLDRKLQELVLLAVSASCTTVYRPGIKAHTQGAIAAGASDAEILETLELCSVLGIHAITFAVPVLLETLQEQGRAIEKPAVWDQRQQKLKDEFIAKRGFYTEIWDDILSVDADYFAAYTDFSSVTTVNGRGALSPKAKELLLCAIDCSPTHMVYLGLKAHMRQALNLGATPEELMEVFELTSLMGVHTVLEGAQALVDAHKGAHNSSVL